MSAIKTVVKAIQGPFDDCSINITTQEVDANRFLWLEMTDKKREVTNVDKIHYQPCPGKVLPRYRRSDNHDSYMMDGYE